MKFKALVAFSILVLILTLGAASANDNTTDNIAHDLDCEVLENATEGNTFGDIQKAINEAKEMDVIELNGTYTSSGSEIKITKSLEFNGGSNGATLDAKGLSGIFTTSLKKYNITLKNINFINAKNSVFIDTDNYNSKSLLCIDNCNFTDNEGKEFGAIACYDCIISNSNFINNKAKGFYDGEEYVSWGGALNVAQATLTNCNFERNTALNHGGAIDGGTVYADYCNFRENFAKYLGGAISANVYLNNTNFTSNWVSENSGGAIFGGGSIFNCIFDSNKADYKGGAIYGSVEVANSKFINNSAEYGGAIHDSYENIVITNSTFESNNDASIIAHSISVDSKVFKGKKVLDDNFNPITLVKASVKKITTTYDSGKTLEIKLVKTTSNKPAPYLGIYVEVLKGKKIANVWMYVDQFLHANKNGIARFKASKLPVGTYTIEVMEGYEDDDDDYFACPIQKATVTVKITKAKTSVKAPKVTAKSKKSKYFKVTVKNKATKKLVKGLKLKVKVYTGKKYKTYNIKTNKKGVAKLNTKKLKHGSHKVVISSKNKNYNVSKKSKIIIK